MCFWPPPKASKKIKKLVLSFAAPSEDWPQFPVKVLNSASNYEKAKRKLKKSEETSNLSRENLTDHESRKNLNVVHDVPLPVLDNSSHHGRVTPRQNLYQNLTSTPCSSVQGNSSRLLDRHSVAQPSDEAFQRKVLRLLEEIKNDQAYIRSMLQSVATNKDLQSGIPDDCILPVDSPEKLCEFDKYLSDKAKFSQICNYFGSFGGHSSSSLIRRILQTLLTNSLSTRYNWEGTGGVKLAFQQFKNIIRVISTSVRNHQQFEKVAEHEIETAIKKWLVYAKDRDGGRMHRRAVTNANNNV